MEAVRRAAIAVAAFIRRSGSRAPWRAVAAAALLHAVCASSAVAHGGADANQGHRGPNLDFVATSFGQTGDPKRVTRTIRVTGDDSMRFSPSRITVRQGETIRLVFTNTGALKHESVLGTLADLKQHAELMKKFPQMEHDEPFMVHAGPGESGEMIWQFTRSGEFHFGCLMPGHFEAGMRGTIVVIPRAAAAKRRSG
jgi:uncharacterized cupredoxin-like copper-binding protein